MVLKLLGVITPLLVVAVKFFLDRRALQSEKEELEDKKEELEKKEAELLENIEEKKKTIEDVREAISTLSTISQGEETDNEKLKDVLDKLEKTVLPVEHQILSKQDRIQTQVCHTNEEIEELKEGEDNA